MQSNTDISPSESTRTYVSLLLFMHLFCVVVVLSSNHFPSRLQAKLSKAVAIYTKTLHLDPNSAKFELTDGEQGLTRLHQWEVLESAESLTSKDDNGDRVALRLPQTDRSLWNRIDSQPRREELYSRLAASYATNEKLDDEVCATMARDLARHCFSTQSQTTAKQQLLIRCVSLADEEPSAIYEADAWQTEAGELQILKRMEARRTAPAR